ncbi:unnamed protein product [Bursaphelenchus xylophilus]|uniref:(pine wood nematode) hypothetical protein n=1 Tax=Bursaphelenchus xylophilus TaxID=6326 RepID=A0A7I8XQA2_BURXY|nr:unnamed protein product [Bursaphelenchus xylophilus]CAG9122051.1 unnamed protein product [Bursaphelenchus xylophilus]
MVAPLEVGFYTEIIGFLQCIKLEDTFQGTKPNGFEIITHDFAPTKVIVEYRYNSVWKNVTRKPLDLVDKDEEGFQSYRVFLNQVGEEVKVGVSGIKGDVCPIFNKTFVEENCDAKRYSFFELLGSSMAKIGCNAETRPENKLYSPTGEVVTSYKQETTDNFDCQSMVGVFDKKLVFRKKGSEECKQLDWEEKKWDASPCQPAEYNLTSSNRLLLSLKYLVVMFETSNCTRPAQLSLEFLDNTYVEYLFIHLTKDNASNVSTAEGSALAKADIIGMIAGIIAGVVAVTMVVAFLIWWFCKDKCRRKKKFEGPAAFVRYDFGVPPEMEGSSLSCDAGYDQLVLADNSTLHVPKKVTSGDVEYTVDKLVRKGAFGAVYHYTPGDKSLTGIAVKLEIDVTSKGNQPLINEASILQLRRAERCLSDGYIIEFFSGGRFKKDVFFILTAPYGPSVSELRNGAILESDDVARLAYQLLMCIKALHNVYVSHRAISEDVFLYQQIDSKSFKYVITDLGWAVKVYSRRDPYYPYPELAPTNMGKTVLYSDDVESLMYMLQNMLMDKLPWAGETNMAKMAKAKYSFYRSLGSMNKGQRTIHCFWSVMWSRETDKNKLVYEIMRGVQDILGTPGCQKFEKKKKIDRRLPVKWPGRQIDMNMRFHDIFVVDEEHDQTTMISAIYVQKKDEEE